MTVLVTKVTLEGDFFKRDPSKTVRENIRDMLDELSVWMEAEVQGQVTARRYSMPYYTGYTADHVAGYTTSPRTGKRWQLHAAVGVPTTGMNREQAIRTKAAAVGIEARWHPFRKVKSAIYRARPWINANFMEGLE